jgi:hypothetical protein
MLARKLVENTTKGRVPNAANNLASPFLPSVPDKALTGHLKTPIV